jgi:hypothetical protein
MIELADSHAQRARMQGQCCALRGVAHDLRDHRSAGFPQVREPAVHGFLTERGASNKLSQLLEREAARGGAAPGAA